MFIRSDSFRRAFEAEWLRQIDSADNRERGAIKRFRPSPPRDLLVSERRAARPKGRASKGRIRRRKRSNRKSAAALRIEELQQPPKLRLGNPAPGAGLRRFDIGHSMWR